MTRGLFLWMCVVYEALGDILRMDFSMAFLQLWLRMVSLELWLGIEGKHVAFLELWLVMTSLELWLGMADGHEHSLSCGSDWRVYQVWLCELWLVRMDPERLSFLTLVGKYGSLGTLRTIVRIGNTTYCYRVWSAVGFLHVFYKL